MKSNIQCRCRASGDAVGGHIRRAGGGRPTLAVVAALVIPAIVSVFQHVRGPGTRLLAVIVLSLAAIAGHRLCGALRQHDRVDARLAYQGAHDQLTGLPNRVHALEQLTRMAAEVGSGSAPVAVVVLDVDHFKSVNDSGGHSFGDELLVAIGRRLQENAAPGDLVARIGDDEFLVVLADATDRRGAHHLAEGIRRCFAEPFTVGSTAIKASASLGVVLVDGRRAGEEAESFVRDADTAMYHAKASGRDRVAVCDLSMRDRVAERLVLQQDLRHALDHGQLHLHFQPIVEMGGDRVDGFEALLRWTHPARGAVPPVTFIPIAEETGLIVEMGAWVINEATRQLACWRDTIIGGGDLYVAVNLSARQLRDPLLLARVSSALHSHNLPGSALCLELTESLLMEDTASTATVLHELRALGVRLSIDDFGTGYSSLSYLKRFPIDHVKIDRSFVEGLGAPEPSGECLVSAIIAMTSALGMTTVAEGVETVDQAGRLRRLGADWAQGYLFSHPLPPEIVPDALARLGVAGMVPAP